MVHELVFYAALIFITTTTTTTTTMRSRALWATATPISSTSGSNLFARDLCSTYFPHGRPATDTDRVVVEERQLGRRTVPGLFAVGSFCRHGFPQVYVGLPINDRGGISSGMIRLSCPHLVKEIDRIEAEGAIARVDARLATSADLQANFAATNAAWRTIRHASVTPADRAAMEAALGAEGTRVLMDSGIIGCMNTAQAKCLHAHTADHLIRGGNALGEAALDTLRTQGVDPSGCDTCWQQCDRTFTPTEDSWWYVPQKNKQRLATAKTARKLHKAVRDGKKNAPDVPDGS